MTPIYTKHILNFSDFEDKLFEIGETVEVDEYFTLVGKMSGTANTAIQTLSANDIPYTITADDKTFTKRFKTGGSWSASIIRSLIKVTYTGRPKIRAIVASQGTAEGSDRTAGIYLEGAYSPLDGSITVAPTWVNSSEQTCGIIEFQLDEEEYGNTVYLSADGAHCWFYVELIYTTYEDITTADYLNQLQTDKSRLVDNLNNKGQGATTDETFTALVKRVNKIEIPYWQDKEYTLSKDETSVQLTPDPGYNSLSSATVYAYTPNYETVTKEITSNGDETVSPSEGYDGISSIEITTNVQPNLETVTKTITENGTTSITPSEGYDGISSVDITTNVSGSFDISEYFYVDGKYSTAMYRLKKIPPKSVAKVCMLQNGCWGYDFVKNTSSADLSDITSLFDGDDDVTDMHNFCESADITRIYGYMSNFKTSKVTNMSYLFKQATKVTDLLPLANWDTSSVTNMSYMFYDMDGTGTSGMFTKPVYLSPLSNWDTSNVTNMSYMFYNIPAFNDLYSLQNWDTSNVTNMSYMFKSGYNWGYTGSVTLNWCLDKVTSMNNFINPSNSSYGVGTSLSGFYTTENAVTTGINLYQLLQNNGILKTFDFSKVTRTANNISMMLGGCGALELADIRGLTCSGIAYSSSYSGALSSVPTTVKIIVKDDTEKTWWQTNFSNWSSCFYTPEEAIEAGIVTE